MRLYALFLLFPFMCLAADNKQDLQPKRQVLPLAVTVEGFENNGPIPENFAFCARNGKEGVGKGGNNSPKVTWKNAPARTKSFAILMFDPDVPASFELANQEGRVIPQDFPRQTFNHWILFNITPERDSLAFAADSAGVTPRGKTPGQTEFGMRGINDYTKSFMGDAEMDGIYGGYDGPCPPWNDLRLHHYHFRVYALDIRQIMPTRPIEGKGALEAFERHALAMGEVTGTYTTNAAVKEGE